MNPDGQNEQTISANQTGDTNNKPSWFNKKRVLLIAGICFGALIAVVLVLWSLATYLPGEELKEEIQIGSSTITKQSISELSDEMQNYLDEHPYTYFGDSEDDKRTVQEIATERLILHAALQYQANKCGVTLSDDNLDPIYDYSHNFTLIKMQNEIYQDQLYDCTIAYKEIFSMNIMFDSPYFNNLSVADANYQYGEARDRLQNDILPLFQQGLSKEKIAESADVNNLVEREWTAAEGLAHAVKPVLYAGLTTCTVNSCFNDQSETSTYKGNPGDLSSSKEEVAKLRKVGDHTGVFGSQDGTYTIKRLEHISSGAYEDWQDFIDKIEKEFAYNPASVAKTTSQGILGSLNLTPTATARAETDADDTPHNLSVKFVVQNQSGAGIAAKKSNASIQVVRTGCAADARTIKQGKTDAWAINCWCSNNIKNLKFNSGKSTTYTKWKYSSEKTWTEDLGNGWTRYWKTTYQTRKETVSDLELKIISGSWTTGRDGVKHVWLTESGKNSKNYNAAVHLRTGANNEDDLTTITLVLKDKSKATTKTRDITSYYDGYWGDNGCTGICGPPPTPSDEPTEWAYRPEVEVFDYRTIGDNSNHQVLFPSNGKGFSSYTSWSHWAERIDDEEEAAPAVAVGPGTHVPSAYTVLSQGASSYYSTDFNDLNLGGTVCRETWIQGTAWNNPYASWTYEYPCVNLPYDYKVMPYSRVQSTDTATEIGETVTFENTAQREGMTRSRNLPWNTKLYYERNGVKYDIPSSYANGTQTFDDPNNSRTYSLQNYVNFDTYNPSIYRAEPGDKLCTELTIGADWAYASDMYEQNNEAVIELLAKSGGIGDQIDALIEQGAQIEAAGNYKSEFEKLDDEEDQVERDIITLREEILNMQLGIPTLENQIWSLEREIDRLNNSIGTQEENVENYTSRINSLHSTINIETDCPIVTASESSLNDTQKTRLEALKNLIYAGGVNLLKTYCGRLSTAQNNLDNYRATLATKQAEKDENDRKIAEYKALLPVRQTTLYEKIDRLAQIPSARAELSNALDPALAAINAQIDALMAQVLSFVSTQVASYTSSACTTMIKTSNLQLFGSNSWSGGNYGTTCNRDAALSGGFEGKVSKRLSGSWSQYGLLSTGDISNFGSGGHIDDKLANSIFANANASGGIGDLTQLGRYTGSHCITDVYDYYNRQITDNSGKVTHIEHEILGSNDWSIYRPGTFTIDVSKLDKNKWEELGEDGLQRYDIYKVENDVLLNSTSMPSGRDIILLVDGDVTITGDIKTKNSTFGTIYDIPQFTLAVTGNIIVEPTVHEIYGVYAAHDRSAADGKAGGVFYDCGLIDENEAKSTLKFRYSGLCSDYRSEIGNSAYPSPPFTYYQPNNGSLALAAQNVGLTVNGAIVADGTRFHRTNGVESIHDATPAERVRYTPLIYLQEWAYRNRIQNEMKTTLYREIAPRY